MLSLKCCKIVRNKLNKQSVQSNFRTQKKLTAFLNKRFDYQNSIMMQFLMEYHVQ